MQAAMTTWVQVTAGSVRQDTAYWDKIRPVRLGGCVALCRTPRQEHAEQAMGHAGGASHMLGRLRTAWSANLRAK